MAHLRCTSLGWQGWCIRSPSSCLLIDPLLLDEVGRGPRHTRADFPFRVGRRFHFDAMPAVDAVIITHEHEDHFNVPTLARIERTVPLYVSGGVSMAARALLADMGFAVTYVEPGETIDVGDLKVRFFGGNALAASPYGDYDEWETLAFAVWQADEHGCFFSNVDIGLAQDARELLDARIEQGDVLACFDMRLRLWSRETALPDASGAHRSTSAASLSAVGDAEVLLHGGEVEPFPGETLVIDGGRLARVEQQADYLSSLPRSEWIPRKPFALPDGALPEAPVTGAYLGESHRPDVERALRELAEYLYGRWPFQLLMSLRGSLPGRLPRFAMVLFVDQELAWIYEYSLATCDFRPLAIDFDQAIDSYAGVATLWAGDLLALASGEVEPRAIHRAVQEDWAIQIPARAHVTRLFWTMYHPLRFPERVLAQYRRALALEAGAPIVIRPRAL